MDATSPPSRHGNAEAQLEGVVYDRRHRNRNEDAQPPLLRRPQVQEVRDQVYGRRDDEVHASQQDVDVHRHHRYQDHHANRGIAGEKGLEKLGIGVANLLQLPKAPQLRPGKGQQTAQQRDDRAHDGGEKARRVNEGVVDLHAQRRNDDVYAKQDEQNAAEQVLRRVSVLLFLHWVHSF